VARKFLPGRKVEIVEALPTGDRDVDRRLADSLEALKRLREAAALAQAPGVAEELRRIDEAGRKILEAVAGKKARYDEVRKFMDYYLPTADKLIAHYRQLVGAGSGPMVQKAVTGIENSLDMIALAFEKQLDKLYGDEALDITTDIQVLETMMASDGLTDEGIRKAVSNIRNESAARSSAAAQAVQTKKDE
jgi:hypothetical protein